jgi:hypothetical protein
MVSKALSIFSTGMLVHVKCIIVSTHTCKIAQIYFKRPNDINGSNV